MSDKRMQHDPASSSALFDLHRQNIYRYTDRLFAWLMAFQWIAGIIVALSLSPLAWEGARAETHIHVWAALVLGGIVSALPILLAVTLPGTVLTRQVVAVAQMLMSALLIHLTGGRIETHFHVFGSLALLAFYRDPRVLISASLVVALDHFLRGMYWPESVFGVVAASPWRWLEHVGWVAFEDLFLIMAIRQSLAEMRAIAERQANLEKLNQNLEVEVEQRRSIECEREELLQSEQQARLDAEHANRIKDEFLATLSHELRTPLTSMLGWIGIMQRSTIDPATAERGIAAIQRNAKAQLQLIEDLLDVSRIVTGKFKLDVRAVAFASVVEAATEAIRPAASAKQIDLRCDIREFDLFVQGDPARLQQVVWNLLSNAVKFVSSGGRVTVALTRQAGTVQLTVADNGRGIDPRFLPLLFKRFSQADGSITRKQGGLGLGLAISKNIVELHGGTITAQSAGDGQGATFEVQLPLLQQYQQMALVNSKLTKSGLVPLQSRILDGLNVLIVEDERDAQDLIAYVLRTSGANVVAASSSNEALQALVTFKADVLISDIGMPDEDGYAFLRKLRERERAQGRHTPAAALTAFAKEEDRRAALAAGFEHHVPKPVEPEKLAQVVAKMVGRV